MVNTIVKNLSFLLLTLCPFCFISSHSFSQPTIQGDILYGYVQDETGILFIKSNSHLYTIDGYSEGYNVIKTELDSIIPISETPYYYIFTPELNIFDLTQNKVVFKQSDLNLTEIEFIDIVPELDAFFLVASTEAIAAEPATAKKEEEQASDGKKKKFSFKNSMTSLSKGVKDIGDGFKDTFKSDSISFFLVDITTGEPIWKFTPKEEQGKFFKTPNDKPVTLGKDKIVFPFGNNFYCLDAQIGKLLWTANYERDNSILSGFKKALSSGYSQGNNESVGAPLQPSEYFGNFGEELGLLVFENKKEKGKKREKSLYLLNHSGQEQWRIDISDKYLGNFWKKYLLTFDLESYEMFDIKTGQPLWRTPYSVLPEYKYLSVSNFLSDEFLLATHSAKATRIYPKAIDILDPNTSKSLWTEPLRLPPTKQKIELHESGFQLLNKEEKELSFHSYLTKDTLWSYSKKEFNTYTQHNGEYYVATKNGLDRINAEGLNLYGKTLPIIAKDFWKIQDEGEHKLIITKESSSRKNISLVDKEGNLIYQRDWKYANEDSVYFKVVGNEMVYLDRGGVYKLKLSSDEKPETLGKFARKGFRLKYNDDRSKLIVNSKGDFHLVNLEEGSYKFLTENLKFDGKDETMNVSFYEPEGILVQNQENIAFLSYENGLVYQKYYKYPKSSEFGNILLKNAISAASTTYQIHQGSRAVGNEMAYEVSGNSDFSKQASVHNRNSSFVRGQGRKLKGRIDDQMRKREERRQLAGSSTPLAVFSEKRKLDGRKTVVMVRLDPVTGEEIAINEIGEKNPLFYVDPVGGLVYYVDPSNTIKRLDL
ncbi:MAG: hypothetical protein AAF363_12535 [Bacteroidota bacterium]